MRVLIIAFHPRTMTPYSKLYEDTLKENNVEYDIVFWDRFSNGELEHVGNEYIIHKICTLGGSKWKKIMPMFFFRRYVKKILNNTSYDKLIILNTLPAVLLSDILMRKYKEKYIFDIRDYTYERYHFYKKRVDLLIENSFMTSISSRGFMRFLNKNNKIFLNHNISNIKSRDAFQIENLKQKNNINIGFLGVLRYEKENKNLIINLKGSLKYRLFYIGRKYPEVDFEQFCKSNGVRNCFFFGAFENDEKPLLYKKIDIINAIYGNSSLEVSCALPNKLYDCLIFKRPLIASKGTFLGEIVEKYHLGFCVDKLDNIEKMLDEYISQFDKDKFESYTSILLEEVILDQNKIVEKIKQFVM